MLLLDSLQSGNSLQVILTIATHWSFMHARHVQSFSLHHGCCDVLPSLLQEAGFTVWVIGDPIAVMLSQPLNYGL